MPRALCAMRLFPYPDSIAKPGAQRRIPKAECLSINPQRVTRNP